MSWLPGTHRAEPSSDHVANQPQRVEDPRAAVHQIAEEDRLAALGMAVGHGAPERIVGLARPAGSRVAAAVLPVRRSSRARRR